MRGIAPGRPLIAAVLLSLLGGTAVAQARGAVAQSTASAESTDDYGFIDKANSLWEAIGDAPPDYSFAFEGGEPWAWETSDGYWIVVEDQGEGIRSYYFEPGARTPFLTVEPGHSYGYDDGDLAVVYGADGGVLSRAEGGAHYDAAMDLFERGIRIKAAMAPRDWTPVDTGAWLDASPFITGYVQLWSEGRARYPGWRRYRSVWEARALERRLDAERRRRLALTEQFHRWRAGGFQGPPPGRWRKPDPNRPHRPGGPGRPGRPGRPDGVWNRPMPGAGGLPPLPVPEGGTRPRPGSGRPDTGGPDAGRPDSGRPGGRPPRPGRPGAEAPPTVDGAPGTTSPGRPGRPGWGRPRPGTVTTPPPSPDSSGAVATPPPATTPPGRPGWGRPGGGRPRPDGSVTSPAPGAEAPATPPVTPPVTGTPGRRPGWGRPRPDGGVTSPAPGADTAPPRGNWGGRPDRPRPVAPPPQPRAEPGAAPSAEAPALPPRRGNGGAWRVEGAGADTPRPRFRPQPEGAPPAQRPAFTPPPRVERAAPAPAPQVERAAPAPAPRVERPAPPHRAERPAPPPRSAPMRPSKLEPRDD
ncbi:hypothetical protein AB2M62_13910 [Sphingomonas sp. MMS12-HWE2-04]|uniref:hypothetical protein n=1 Tax=Sphingomonas sp. MMS12-HWE2-04 TaxID=3234199 RepID=UPI00384EDF87